MKKTLATILLGLTIPAWAQKPVQIVWPFAIGSPQANMVRAIIEEANTTQNKYTFVLVHKPGAGGSVAANYTLEHNDLAVLASTSSFYIRPLLYKDSHNVDDFKIVSNYCSGQPLAIFSKKLQKLEGAEGKSVSVGVIPGSITTLVTRALQRENKNLSIIEVPYKGTPEATTDMLGGHIEGSIDFIGKSALSRFDNSVKVLGITGSRNIQGFQTFGNQKIKGLDQVANDYYFFVTKKTDTALQIELNKILNNSISTKAREFCEDDFGSVTRTEINQTESLQSQNKIRWANLTQGIKQE